MTSLFQCELANHGYLCLEEGKETKPQSDLIAGILHSFASLGFALDNEALRRLSTCSREQLTAFYGEAYDALSLAKGDNVPHPIFYKDFPHLEELTGFDYFLNAVLHYLTASEEDYGYVPSGKKKGARIPYFPDKVETLHPLSEAEAIKFFVERISNLFSSARAIPFNEIKFIEEFEKAYPNLIHPTSFPFKENMAWFFLLKEKNEGKWGDKLSLRDLAFLDHPTDLLRVYAVISKCRPDLRSKVKFVSLDRKCRRLFLSVLNDMNAHSPQSLVEDFRRHEFLWKRALEKLHPGEFASLYPELHKTVQAFRNGECHTYYGELEKAKGNQSEYLRLLSSRPGEFARRLDATLRNPSYNREETLKAFEAVGDKISSPVLLSLWNYYQYRDQEGTRFFHFNGANHPVYVVAKEKLPPLEASQKEGILRLIESLLRKIYSQRPRLEKVYVDPELKRFALPLNCREASKGHHTLTYGTRVKLDPGQYPFLRAFTHWHNLLDEKGRPYRKVRGEDYGRVDIDLSAEFLDDDFHGRGSLSWHCMDGGKHVNCFHSGDFVTAPRGASEFIDIDLQEARKYCRYVLLCNTVYSAQPFCNIPECFTGVMFLTAEQRDKGEAFQPNRVEYRFDLTTPDADQEVAFVLDLWNMELIWMDIPCSVSHFSVATGSPSLVAATRDAMRPRMDLYTFFKLHDGHVSFVDDPKEAEFVIADKDGADLSPCDEGAIGAHWL